MKENSLSVSYYEDLITLKVLGAIRSTYYVFKSKIPSNRSIENNKLKKEVQTIYDESKVIYGEPKINKIIFRKFNISLKKVQKLINEIGLRFIIIIIKKFKHNTTKVDIVDKDNILDGNISTIIIN